MHKSIFLYGLILVLLYIVTGCRDRDMSHVSSGEKVVGQNAMNNAMEKDLALKFLQGSQSGDKKLMYEAVNLTTDLVKESTDRLVHPANYKQSDAERKEHEDVLRTSGQIDYFSGKLRKLFPRTADISITKTVAIASGTATGGTKSYDHTVTITYKDLAEALSDKTGKVVKVMVVHLIQTNSTVAGRDIHSFSFDGKGFERFADRDFEVVSYY